MKSILVGLNTGRLKGLGGNLLTLERDDVDAEREVIGGGLLAAAVEDANFWVGDTTVVSGFWEGLGRLVFDKVIGIGGTYFILAVAVAPRWPTSHDDGLCVYTGSLFYNALDGVY